MGAISIWHWLIVLAIIMMVFGTSKLKNVGSDLGAAIRDFKDGMKSETTDEDKKIDKKEADASGNIVEGEVTHKKIN